MVRDHDKSILGMSKVFTDTKETMEDCNAELKTKTSQSINRLNQLIGSLIKEDRK